MSISNRDIAVFSKLTAAFEAAASQDKTAAGKEFRRERDAWEKAAGGRDVLANADAHSANLIAAADIEADKRVAAAEAKIRTDRAAFDLEKQRFGKAQVEFDKFLDETTDRAAALALRDTEVKDREDTALGREADIALNAANIVRYGKELDVREAEVKRREDYYAAAPA